MRLRERNLRGSTATRAWLPVITISAILVVAGILAAGDAFWLRVVTSGAILYIVAASFDLAFGRAGLTNLAHVAIYGVGAYTSAVATTDWGLPFWVGLILGGLAGGVTGSLLALPTSKLHSVFLAIGTLAAAVLFEEIVRRWVSVTGGADGLLGIEPAEIFGIQLPGGEEGYYWFTAVFAVLTSIVVFRSVAGPVGRKFAALRSDEALVQALGVRPLSLRIQVLGISGALAGVAGALFSEYALFISPDAFSLGKMIDVLVAVMIGGAGTFFGPAVGVIFLVTINEVGFELGNRQPLVLGVALLVLLPLAPDGLTGLVSGARGG